MLPLNGSQVLKPGERGTKQKASCPCKQLYCSKITVGVHRSSSIPTLNI